MFKRASAEVGVDWTNGLYVGDKISDLKAAVKAKAKPVLVRTGYGEETIKKLICQLKTGGALLIDHYSMNYDI